MFIKRFLCAPEGGAGAGASGTGDDAGKTKTGDSPGNESGNGGEGEGGEGGRTVSWQSHKRALDDLHKFKGQVGELSKKLGDLESQRLQEKNDFKTLYEQEKNKNSDLEKKLGDTNTAFIETTRFGAVKQAAVAAGIRKEALEDLELLPVDKSVNVDVTAQGRFLVSGQKEFVDGLKKTRPHWFAASTPPPVNGGGGGTPPPGTTLTPKDVVKAEMDCKANKITREQYHDVCRKYDEQQRRK